MIDKIKVVAAGWGSHPEGFLLGGFSPKKIRIPALYVLLHHREQGRILFDTGYTSWFFQVTRRWPWKLFHYLTPVEPGSYPERPPEVDKMIISHFHPDHVAGCRQLPETPMLAWREARPDFEQQGWRGLARAVVPSLHPAPGQLEWFDMNCRLEPELAPFKWGADLLQDGSLLAVPLPGHARGQIGLVIPELQVFLVADGCFLSRSLEEQRLPTPLTRLFIDDWQQMKTTFLKLCQFRERNPHYQLIPSHCPRWAGYRKEVTNPTR